METNEQTRIAMAMIAGTIAGAVFASGSAKNEMDLLFILEEKLGALFPTVEPKEILLACSHALVSVNIYRENLGNFDKPEGSIQ